MPCYRAACFAIVVVIGSAMSAGVETAIRFSNVAAAAGITVVNRAGTPTKDFIVDSIGNGVAWLDYDNDGDLDALVVNGSTLERLAQGGDQMVTLYRNE